MKLPAREANGLVDDTSVFLSVMLNGNVSFTGTAAEKIRRLAVDLQKHIGVARARVLDEALHEDA